MSQYIDREHIDWENLTFIAPGPDSHVYQTPDKQLAVKRYRYRPFSVVQAYAELTNRASALLDQNPIEAFLSKSEGSPPLFGVDYKINPVSKVIISQDDQPVTYSPYIPGPMQSINNSKPWEGVIELPQDEQLKLEEIRALFQERCHQSYNFPMLNKFLDRELGVYGITIESRNIKMRFDTTTNRFVYMVTDIAKWFTSIADLWPDKKSPPIIIQERHEDWITGITTIKLTSS